MYADTKQSDDAYQQYLALHKKSETCREELAEVWALLVELQRDPRSPASLTSQQKKFLEKTALYETARKNEQEWITSLREQVKQQAGAYNNAKTSAAAVAKETKDLQPAAFRQAGRSADQEESSRPHPNTGNKGILNKMAPDGSSTPISNSLEAAYRKQRKNTSKLLSRN